MAGCSPCRTPKRPRCCAKRRVCQQNLPQWRHRRPCSRWPSACVKRRRIVRCSNASACCSVPVTWTWFAAEGQAADPLYRQIAAGFGNLAEAIRQAVALSHQVAGDVPHLVAENEDLLRQSQSQVSALEEVLVATRRLLQGLQGAGEELRAVVSIAAQADASVREGLSGGADSAKRSVRWSGVARATEVIEVIDAVSMQTNILSINAGIEAAHAGGGTRLRRSRHRDTAARRRRRRRARRTRHAGKSGRRWRKARSPRRPPTGLGRIGDLLGRAGRAMGPRAAGWPPRATRSPRSTAPLNM